MKFTISYPIKPQIISQTFGVNSQFYSQSQYGGIKGHNGIDFIAQHGLPVYAIHDGTAYYEYDGSQGEGVVIHTNTQFDDNKGNQCYYKTIYWHLCSAIKEPKFTSPIYIAVGYHPDMSGISNKGIQVKEGDLIGYADNTGTSTGDHLHLGLKPCAIGEPSGSWYNIEQNNGYNGAIDPIPFFSGRFAIDAPIFEKALETATEIIKEIPTVDATIQQKFNLLQMIKNLFSRFF